MESASGSRLVGLPDPCGLADIGDGSICGDSGRDGVPDTGPRGFILHCHPRDIRPVQVREGAVSSHQAAVIS